MSPRKSQKKWEVAVWSGCMLFGVIMLVSELALASRSDAEVASRVLAREAVKAMAEPAPTPKPSAVAVPEPMAAAPVAAPKAPAAVPVAAVQDASICGELLVDAIIQVESAGNPRRVGRQGELGLMQIKPENWSRITCELYGKKLPLNVAFDPVVNRRVGKAYLATLQAFLMENRNRWKADERSLLLACYNAGPDRVRQAGFALAKLPSMTKDYIRRASALHDDMLADRTRLAEAEARGPGRS